MSIELSKEELLSVIPGKSGAERKGISFSGLEFDSREVRGGELFMALSGGETHGEQFIEGAFERGAAFVVCESERFLSKEFRGGEFAERVLVVENSLKAFERLASWWRKELALPVLAISGSVGKTSVKELAAALLLENSLGGFSKKSFNNHVGVPYTLCQLSKSHEWAVLEMGMNHSGELTELSKLATPTAAMLTKIALAHAGNFDSIEGIAAAKFEIFEGLEKGSPVILNADDELMMRFAQERDFNNRFEVFTFGRSASAAMRLLSLSLDSADGMRLELEGLGERFELSSKLLGEHNAMNIAAAVLGAKLLRPQLKTEQIKTALARHQAPPMRMQLEMLATGRSLLNDAYNANPASMRAALDVLAGFRDKHRVAILGEMFELGEHSEELHREIGEYAAKLGVEELIVLGGQTQAVIEGFKSAGGERFFEAESPVAAASLLSKLDFDVVLLKGSRGMKLEEALGPIRHNEAIRSVA